MNWEITAAVVGWLRYEQRCVMCFWERSPFQEWRYRPDICGITRDRKVIEVEVKQTLSDFKANSEKRGLDCRRGVPVRFYFAVPPALVEKVQPILPEGAGLLTIDGQNQFGPCIRCVVPATHRKDATKISPNEVGRLLMHQTGSLHRAVVALARKSNEPTQPD